MSVARERDAGFSATQHHLLLRRHEKPLAIGVDIDLCGRIVERPG
jgi:methylaspartate ammonia-lyase